MYKFLKKYLTLIMSVVISVTIIMTLIGSILITYNKLSMFDYSIWIICCAIISLIVYIINKCINKSKFDIYDYFIFVLIFFAILSLSNAKNLNVAIFGFKDRNEGLLVWISYYIFFLISKNIKDYRSIKIIMSLIIMVGLCNSIYGYLQIYEPYFKLFEIKYAWMYARGLLGNPNFLGTMMALTYPLILGIYLKNDNRFIKVLLYILLFIFSFGVISTGCLSCYLSIFIIYIILGIYVIYLLIKKKYKLGLNKICYIIFAIIALIMSYKIFTVRNYSIDYDLKMFFSETENISNGEVSDNFGTGRFYIWNNTLKAIKENSFTGVGIDNFYYAFDEPLVDSLTGYHIDKAHNDYLQKMLCEGIVSGIIFIVFLLIIFFKSFSRLENKIYFPLFLSFTAYSIQAFFNISFTRVAPLYFIIMGLLMSDINLKKTK